jgi:hypothetical protein
MASTSQKNVILIFTAVNTLNLGKAYFCITVYVTNIWTAFAIYTSKIFVLTFIVVIFCVIFAIPAASLESAYTMIVLYTIVTNF